MSQNIIAWETEDPDVVVWNTHNPQLALEASNKFYREDCGLDPELENLPDLTVFQGARRLWGNPELMELELWPKTMISKEPVEGWIPYLVASL